jgi:hypothetical protein
MTYFSAMPFGAIAGPVQPIMPSLPSNGVMLVGEAPGQTESILGVPFTGPAGKLLDQVLTELGVQRRATLIANVFRWQPTWTATADGKRRNNDISSFFVDNQALAAPGVAPYHGRSLHISHLPDIEFLHDLIRSAARSPSGRSPAKTGSSKTGARS